MDTPGAVGTPTFDFIGTGTNTITYEGLANVASAAFGTGTVANGKVMEFEVVAPVTPTSHTTGVSAGASYNTLPPLDRHRRASEARQRLPMRHRQYQRQRERFLLRARATSAASPATWPP